VLDGLGSFRRDTVVNKHDFYELANAQGQKRRYNETFDEFESRVLNLHKVREKNKNVSEWRKDSGE